MRILIADDHSIVRRGLRQILLEEFHSAEIIEVADSSSLIEKVLQEDWAVIISDLSMPGRSGLEVLPQLKQIKPTIPVLILSIHPEEQYALRVLKAGASGYLSKDLAPDELVVAVKRVLLGKKYISQSIADKLAMSLHKENDKPLHESLSDREFSVFKLLASGKSTSEIAADLLLSLTTVSTYRSRILIKMKLKNNTELTLYAIENSIM